MPQFKKLQNTNKIAQISVPSNILIQPNEVNEKQLLLQSSLILLATQPSEFVGHNNIQLRRTLNNFLSFLCRHIVSYLRTVCPENKQTKGLDIHFLFHTRQREEL